MSIDEEMRGLDSWPGVHIDSKQSALSMSMDAMSMVCANSVKMNNSAFFTSSAVSVLPVAKGEQKVELKPGLLRLCQGLAIVQQSWWCRTLTASRAGTSGKGRFRQEGLAMMT